MTTVQATSSQIETDVARKTFSQIMTEMRTINLRWSIFIGIYVLLMPQLFLEPGVISAVVVLIHSLVFIRKLNSIRGDRHCIFETIISGLIVYGCCWLLISLQIRSNLQSLLFQHPYHLAPLWSEHWAPIRWFSLFLVVALTTLSATHSQRNRVAMLAMASFWAIAILPTVWHLPWLSSYARYLVSPPFDQVLRDLGKQNDDHVALANKAALNFRQGEYVNAELWKLWRLASLSGNEPSDAWCQEFEGLLKQEKVAGAAWQTLGAEPQFQQTIDAYLKRKHGLVGEIDSSLAANTLDRLGRGGFHLDNTFLKIRVIELVAPHLDQQQLIERITNSKCGECGVNDFIDWHRDPELNPIKPWIYAAILLNRKHNETNPTEYNELQTSIGRHQFRNDPPTPMSRQTRMIMNTILKPDSRGSGLDVLAEMAIPQMEAHRRPLCAGNDSDEFLRRRWLWSLGSQQQLGNTHVKESEYAMLFLDSKGGTQWRQANRNRILEVARDSIAPLTKKPKFINRDASIAWGAVMSVLSQGAKREAWPLPQHLGFLFLDRKTESRPSVAFEFWPEFDAGIDSLEKLSDAYRLSMRWNYLAKMWPESDTEMFVSCYLKASPEARQHCLLGVYMDSIGIPRTIPVSAQVEILKRIREELQKLPGVEGGIYLERHQGKTTNEYETLDHALCQIDSVDGAAMYLKLNESRLKKLSMPVDGYQRYSTVKYEFSQSDHKYVSRTRRWLNNRMTQLSKHWNPKLRIQAVQFIKVRPVPEYISLLDSLQLDTDNEVRKAANEVAAYLNELKAEGPVTAVEEKANHLSSEQPVD